MIHTTGLILDTSGSNDELSFFFRRCLCFNEIVCGNQTDNVVEFVLVDSGKIYSE